MTALQIYDRYAFDEAMQVRKTGDGYLVAMPRVARTGIQLYRGSELGMPQMDVVRVYRPPEEVFRKDSLRTYAFKPVTNNHPPKPVTADNWRDYTVGLIGEEVARDGEFIRVPMTVMDGRAIRDVEDGKVELSMGYTTVIKWEKGTTPDTNETYDAIQTAIAVNHVAIVDAARGGQKLKIGDLTASDPQTQRADAAAIHQGDDAMTDIKTTTITVDGVSLQMSDTAAQVVQRSVKDLTDKLNSSTAQVTTLTQDAAKAKSEHEAAIAKLTTDHKTTVDGLNAQIETLKKQLADATITPDKLEAMVKDRTEMLTKAKAILGDKLEIKDKTDADIRKQVVLHAVGDAAKGWTDDQVKISFDTLVAKVQVTAPGVTDTANAFNRPSHGGSTVPVVTQDQRNKMYADRDAKLSQRWQNPGGAKVA